VEKCDEGVWKQIKDRCVGVIDAVLIGGGSPCQDLSVLNTGRKHLKGDRSKLFWHFPRLVKEAKVYFPEVEIHFMLENVMSMTLTSRRMISAALSSRPWLLDGRWFTHCRRPRLFWTSWPLQAHECFHIIAHEDYDELVVRVQKFDHSVWVKEGWQWPADNAELLPTLTRVVRRKHPMKDPAGLAQASFVAIERWELEDFSRQVYNYEDRVMLFNPLTGARRLPNVTACEILMGFDANYTLGGFKKITGRVLDECRSFLGNTFCVPVVTWILSHWLVRIKYADELCPPETGLNLLSLPKPWSEQDLFCKRSHPVSTRECQLVPNYLA
jgi:hypothetical protein